MTAGLPAREDRTGELVVQAGAHHVFLEADVVRQRRGEGGAEAAEIDVEVFDLGGPVAEEGVFEAGAGGPADAGFAGAQRQRIDRRLDVAECGAAGDVRHEPIEGVADAAARGGEPLVRGFAGQAEAAVGAALEVGPGDVALKAPDERTGLVVVAERAADDESRRAGVDVERAPVRFAPAVAAR